ncbi:MAG: hypothetical protein ABIG85_01820 [Chloroflexota bacterium]
MIFFLAVVVFLAAVSAIRRAVGRARFAVLLARFGAGLRRRFAALVRAAVPTLVRDFGRAFAAEARFRTSLRGLAARRPLGVAPRTGVRLGGFLAMGASFRPNGAAALTMFR